MARFNSGTPGPTTVTAGQPLRRTRPPPALKAESRLQINFTIRARAGMPASCDAPSGEQVRPGKLVVCRPGPDGPSTQRLPPIPRPPHPHLHLLLSRPARARE